MHAPSQKNVNLALFDFDGTLCKRDSFTGFIFYALSKRHIVKQGLKILPWIQAYYLNIYPANSMRPKLYRTMFSGADTQEIQQLAREYAQHIMTQLDPLLYRQFLHHKKNQDRIVIVSASIDIYLTMICELLEVDLICTETEIFQEQYTGEYTSTDCSSEQKKLRILEQYNLDHYQYIYAYGNSEEDVEMLSLADFKYMVGETLQLPEVKTIYDPVHVEEIN